MLIWILNEKEKTFKLCGEYDCLLTHSAIGKDMVYYDECDYQLPKEAVDNFFSTFANIVSEYKFLVNEEKYKKYNFFKDFPIDWYVHVVKINENKEVEKCHVSTESYSKEIQIIEEFLTMLGYEYFLGRYNWKEVTEYEKEGYKYLRYGASKACYLFAKKK